MSGLVTSLFAPPADDARAQHVHVSLAMHTAVHNAHACQRTCMDCRVCVFYLGLSSVKSAAWLQLRWPFPSPLRLLLHPKRFQ